jgi:hypothetical protein
MIAANGALQTLTATFEEVERSQINDTHYLTAIENDFGSTDLELLRSQLAECSKLAADPEGSFAAQSHEFRFTPCANYDGQTRAEIVVKYLFDENKNLREQTPAGMREKLRVQGIEESVRSQARETERLRNQPPSPAMMPIVI